MFNIPTPGIHQRKSIIDADFNKLCTRTGIEVKTARDDVMMLAERIDLDLRNVTRLVRDSFIGALRHKNHLAAIPLPPVSKPLMGFI